MENKNKGDDVLGVAVLTPAGTFPNDKDYRRAHETQKIEEILKEAADELKITNTADWVVVHDEREISPTQTFLEAGLSCVVELEWHKREGGGGA